MICNSPFVSEFIQGKTLFLPNVKIPLNICFPQANSLDTFAVFQDACGNLSIM